MFSDINYTKEATCSISVPVGCTLYLVYLIKMFITLSNLTIMYFNSQSEKIISINFEIYVPVALQNNASWFNVHII